MTTKKKSEPQTFNHYAHRKITVDCSSPKLTEQHHAKACDINNIVAQFQKTGIMPQSFKIPNYLDNTSTPDLVDVFYTVQEAQEAFLTLPSNIRKLMDNDPAQMERFMLNPENTDILKKHGLLVDKPQTQQKSTQEPETKKETPENGKT